MSLISVNNLTFGYDGSLKNIFENVSQPDLVDYAIYKVEAAEKKYIYLLRQIKNGNTN